MIFVVLYIPLSSSLCSCLSLSHLRCIWDGLLVGSLVNIKEADDGLLWGAEKEQRLITATISMSSTFKGAQPGKRSREAKAKLVHFSSSHLQQEEVAAQCPLFLDDFDKIIVIMAKMSFTSSTTILWRFLITNVAQIKVCKVDFTKKKKKLYCLVVKSHHYPVIGCFFNYGHFSLCG